jgi:hypothetical protein
VAAARRGTVMTASDKVRLATPDSTYGAYENSPSGRILYQTADL